MNDEKTKRYIEILKKNFKRGFRIDSVIEIKRFRGFYKEIYDEEIRENDKEIQENIRRLGMDFDGRIYESTSIMSGNIIERIFNYIQARFNAGNRIVYYTNIYNEFINELEEKSITSSEMLRRVLEFYNQGKYFVKKKYLTQEEDINPLEQIRACMVEHGAAMNYEEVHDVLPEIPLSKIKSVLSGNKEFINIAPSQYIHVENILIGEEELIGIKKIIEKEILKNKFMPGNELMMTIKENKNKIFERNSEISVLGLRNAIAYRLDKEFSFNGNIISNKGENLSMNDAFEYYCKTRDKISVQELIQIKKDWGTNIYFDIIYTNMVRINEETFIRKDKVKFDIEKIDDIISKFCCDSYIGINEIEQFSLFPSIGYSWNKFLLESYVFLYSNKFKVLHTGFNMNKCIGVISKKETKLKEYRDVLADSLAKADIELNNTIALDYLYKNDLIGRRSLSDIDEIISMANNIRLKRRQ